MKQAVNASQNGGLSNAEISKAALILAFVFPQDLIGFLPLPSHPDSMRVRLL